MGDFDVIAYLASKGHRGKPVAGGREVTYPCWFECGEPLDSKKRKLYVSASEGFYQCKVCGVQGGPYTLQRSFGDDPRTGTSDDVYTRMRILDSATQVGITSLENNDDVLLYLLNDRGLSAETIIERRLGFIAGGWSLVGSLPEDIPTAQLPGTGLVYRDGPRAGKDFFFRHILIPVRRHGHTVQIRGRAWGEARGGKYMTGPGEPTRIFNADSLDGAEEVIVTEGEFDAMILAQALGASVEPRAQAMAVIGLPGTNAVPDDFDDVLSDVKRIFLGLDSDEAGRKAAQQLKDRLGTRARILELPFEDGRKCDWTEYLLPSAGLTSTWRTDHPYTGHDDRDVLRLLSSAAGKRVFSIAEAGESFRTYRQAHGGLKSGYTGLDEVIQPGMLPGQVVVVLAKTGAGKTVWLCNLAYNMRAHPLLFMSLEMTREEIYDRLRRIYLFHHPTASDYEVEHGLSNVYVSDENRVGARDFANLISEYVVEAGIKPEVVFVDYLGYFARGAQGNSPYEKVTEAVMQLKREAKAGRFVVVAPHQVNRGAKEGKPIDLDDARDSGAVEETADFLLALFRPDDGLTTDGLNNNQPPSGKVKLSILKSRHGGKGHVLSLQMDLLTLAVVNDNTPAALIARDHNARSRRGTTWDDLYRENRQPLQLNLPEAVT